MAGDPTEALRLERSCSLVATALSEGRRTGARLVTGAHRGFGMNVGRTVVDVPYPPVRADWTARTLTCGIALQCSPSKDRVGQYPLHELTLRQFRALTIVEGEVALGWVGSRWTGLLPEFARLLPTMEPQSEELDGPTMLDRAQALARSNQDLNAHPLLGVLPMLGHASGGLMRALRKMYGQMPWSSNRVLSKSLHTIPVGGQGGAQNPNLPPPSHPEDDDPEIGADRRSGIPYPEWNGWIERFLPDHVAVLERKQAARRCSAASVDPSLRRWFEERTHRVLKNGLEDGCDLDVDRYIDHHIDTRVGVTSDARVFRDLIPAIRDVTTALLLDGSSSLGAGQGRVFQLELACADALCQAMSLARERHGLFVFSGNTRHRVDVTCLKDFDEPRAVVPSGMGLTTGGYTRLGAPIRHLTSRLLQQPSERRLLIIIGDGLMSDEGYEGKYAWADVAHALAEAEEAAVSIYYIAVGPIRVDPLPDVFGARRSRRIRRVEELPRVLAHVHRELVSA